MLSRRALLLAVLVAPLAARAQFPVVDGPTVRARMAAKDRPVLVDTRLPEEYRQAHIPGAINIPAAEVKAQAARLPKDRSATIVFYCRGSGCTLSHAAATAAAELGYTRLLLYQGGMPDWLLRGFPVEKGAPPPAGARSARPTR